MIDKSVPAARWLENYIIHRLLTTHIKPVMVRSNNIILVLSLYLVCLHELMETTLCVL